MTVMNLRRNAGPNPCWGAGIPGNQYPAPRQAGMGRVTGTAGYDSITYVGDSEPIYIWNITGPTSTISITDYQSNGCSNPDTSTNYIQSGRDYFVGTPKPGYQKYTYPHPLRNSDSSSPPTSTTASSVTPGSPHYFHKGKKEGLKKVKRGKWGKAKENSTYGVAEGQKELGE